MYLNTTPNSNDMWKEFGGNYETAEQSMNELVDNSISNILGHNTERKKIEITLEETNDIDQAIIITIEDSGLGIKNAEEALTIGKVGSDSVLNEHGFGLIQALAAANKENDAWEIYNRTPENKANNEIMHIMAPYIIGKQLYKMEPDSEWPGHEWGSTFLRVRCNFKLFQNLLRKRRIHSVVVNQEQFANRIRLRAYAFDRAFNNIPLPPACGNHCRHTIFHTLSSTSS